MAAAAVTVELLFAAVPTVRLLRKTSSWRGEWDMPLRIAGVTVLSAGLGHTMGDGGGLVSAAVAAVLYLLLSLAFGVVSRPRIAALLATRRP